METDPGQGQADSRSPTSSLTIPLFEIYLLFISLPHVWETICDARASRLWQCKIFAHFAQITIWLPKNTLSPPLPLKWKVGQILALVLTNPEYPPPHLKLKFRQNLAVWVLTTPEYTPPQLKFRQNLALWVLTTPEYPLPPNWNLDRSWHFEFWLLQNPPNWI